MLSSAISTMNHLKYKPDQWAAAIQKWLFEKSEKGVAVNNFLMESHRPSLCFGVKSSFQWNMCFSCLFVVLKSRDVWHSYFWQNILIKLQHAKLKVYHSWKLKVFWLQNWPDFCLNDLMTNTRWLNNFWAHTPSFEPHHRTKLY